MSEKIVRRFTRDEQEFMVAAFRTSTVREIADALGRHWSSVNLWLINHGYRRADAARLKDDYERVGNMLDKLFEGSEYNRKYRDLPDPKGFSNVQRFLS